jgi:hypothetical protein
MRPKERMELLETLGLELQQRYTYADIDQFLRTLNISTANVDWGSSNSKRVYAKAVLGRVSDADLLRVAQEMDIVPPGSTYTPPIPPKNWEGTSDFRLFISHISKDKQIATRLKQALAQYDINGFVAHEDIHPTLAWQDEIERALQTMDAFIAVHTVGFSASIWTQQEIGYAVGRGVKVISFQYGEAPTGFIGKHQAIPRQARNAEQIAAVVDALLSEDARTKERLAKAKDAAPF